MSQIPDYENFAKCVAFMCCLDESLLDVKIDELPDSHELKTCIDQSVNSPINIFCTKRKKKSVTYYSQLFHLDTNP